MGNCDGKCCKAGWCVAHAERTARAVFGSALFCVVWVTVGDGCVTALVELDPLAVDSCVVTVSMDSVTVRPHVDCCDDKSEKYSARDVMHSADVLSTLCVLTMAWAALVREHVGVGER